ncbi:MAG: hypothetical protein K2Q14_06040 [Gammaproteobacteria bacterium]|nr:hypothetical protein [Gammaproteobacteria bacterium]
MTESFLAEHYVQQKEYATFIHDKRAEFPDLLERVKLKTPWHIIEEICAGNYENLDEKIESSLAYDTTKIMGAKLW